MEDERQKMVYEIEEKYGLRSPDVLSVMLQIPRHKFVDEKYWDAAYSDEPVPIGFGQTMSQPFTVAFMTNLVVSTKDKGQRAKGKSKILEIGTGSGYQAAILSYFFKEVYTVEIIRRLADRAKNTLTELGYKNVFVKEGSGEYGWKENSPFDAIIVTAGIEDKVPKALFSQLKEGGVLVAPIGKGPDKIMTRITKQSKSKNKNKYKKELFGTFRFVPFVNEKTIS